MLSFKQVKSTVKKFCDNYITTDMNNLEKILTAQLYMAGNCTYAATWKKNGANTAWGSLVYKNLFMQIPNPSILV